MIIINFIEHKILLASSQVCFLIRLYIMNDILMSWDYDPMNYHDVDEKSVYATWHAE